MGYMDDHAVVIGGSIAGLLTARVLADFYREVTIVEKDDLPEKPTVRRGIPQGSHLHVLQQGGHEIFEELFPGLTKRSQELGAEVADACKVVARYTGRGWLTRASSEVPSLLQRRPRLEHVTREMMLERPTVKIVAATALAPLSAVDRKRVTGILVRRDDGSEEAIEADLVVDAAGRASRAPAWFESLGYRAPDEATVESFMGYASRVVKVPEEAWPGDMRAMNSMPVPGFTRGGVIHIQDNGVHLVTAGGQARDYPPKGEEEFAEYLRTSMCPALHDVYARAEPLSEIVTTRTGVNRLRRFDRLAARPARFIPIGDAVCAFDPIYGQGMTTAALCARHLGRELARTEDIDAVVESFPADVLSVTEFAWNLATGVDAHFPGAVVQGVDTGSAREEDAAYFRAVQDCATEDPDVLVALVETQGRMTSEPIRRPEIAKRVRAWAESGRTPTNDDPTRPPATAVERSLI